MSEKDVKRSEKVIRSKTQDEGGGLSVFRPEISSSNRLNDGTVRSLRNGGFVHWQDLNSVTKWEFLKKVPISDVEIGDLEEDMNDRLIEFKKPGSRTPKKDESQVRREKRKHPEPEQIAREVENVTRHFITDHLGFEKPVEISYLVLSRKPPEILMRFQVKEDIGLFVGAQYLTFRGLFALTKRAVAQKLRTSFELKFELNGAPLILPELEELKVEEKALLSPQEVIAYLDSLKQSLGEGGLTQAIDKVLGFLETLQEHQ